MIEDLEKKLKAPFPVENLHWKIGQRNKEKTRAEMLVYIDARDVMDRLDEVCGLNWQDDYKEVNGRIICTITIDGISKSDGAGDTNIEGDKGGISDAFKRAAVKWGIGRYLYDAGKYNTWIDIVNEKGEQIPNWNVLDFGSNKGKLDKVARMLSGLEKTPAEKAKATREENAEKKAEIEKRIDAGIKHFTGTPNGQQERISISVLDTCVDLIAKGRQCKASNVIEFADIVCEKAKHYAETATADLTAKETNLIDSLIKEVASLDSSLLSGNELAKVMANLDKINF